MTMPSILVAAPTYSGKGYALDQYLAAYRAFDYAGDRALLLADNTADGGEWAAEVASRLQPGEHVIRTVRDDASLLVTMMNAWEAIINVALQANVPLIASIEQDVIVGPSALTAMQSIIAALDVTLVSHEVPIRWRQDVVAIDTMCCVLMTTDRVVKANAGVLDDPELRAMWGEGWGLESGVHYGGRKAYVGGLFSVEHLHSDDEGFPFPGIDQRMPVTEAVSHA